MLTAILVSLALNSAKAEPTRPRLIEPKAACRIALSDKKPTGTYSIRGRYFADGHHGSEIEIPGCDLGFIAYPEGKAEATINAYHRAFHKKCGGILMGDSFAGLFSGKFVRKKAPARENWPSSTYFVFVIGDVQTRELNTTSIICSK